MRSGRWFGSLHFLRRSCGSPEDTLLSQPPGRFLTRCLLSVRLHLFVSITSCSCSVTSLSYGGGPALPLDNTGSEERDTISTHRGERRCTENPEEKRPPVHTVCKEAWPIRMPELGVGSGMPFSKPAPSRGCQAVELGLEPVGKITVNN